MNAACRIVLSGIACRPTSPVLLQRLFSGVSKLGSHVDGGKPPTIPSNVVLLGVDENISKIATDTRPVLASPQNLELIRKVKRCPRHRNPEVIELSSLTADFSPTAAIELHPEVFSCNPRIDYIYLCKEWQRKYREVDYSWKPTRAEVGRGRKKPWPQKGTGRARHGSTVAPQWKGGGVAHGPRGPKPLYQKILPHVRLQALISMLTIKFHQQDLSVVDNLDISSPEPENFREVLNSKGITGSALVVHSEDDDIEGQPDICAAIEDWPDINLFPVVGLNVWSLLQHDKLILTLNAIEEIETKIVWNLHKYGWIGKPHNFYSDLPFKTG